MPCVHCGRPVVRRAARLASKGQQDPTIPWLWFEEEEEEEGVEEEEAEEDGEVEEGGLVE